MKIYFSIKTTTPASQKILLSPQSARENNVPEGSFQVIEPALISIGLADDEGGCFYAELTDTYIREDCDKACKETILPALTKLADPTANGIRVTISELGVKLMEWLKPRHEATLWCVGEKDLKVFTSIFKLGIPHLMKAKRLGIVNRMQLSLLEKNFDIYKTHDLTRHNALGEALATMILMEHKW